MANPSTTLDLKPQRLLFILLSPIISTNSGIQLIEAMQPFKTIFIATVALAGYASAQCSQNCGAVGLCCQAAINQCTICI